MLSYRHAFHAGNFADLLKHLLLVQILDYLVQKPAAVRYIDTHAGTGRYRLDTAEAQQTQEYRAGIGLLWGRSPLPEPVSRYVDLVRACNPGPELSVYPGSPWFANQILRDQDRLDLCELHPRDYPQLRANFAGQRRKVRCHFEDGYSKSLSLVPPAERRGLVLIDPSYELKQDYPQVVRQVQKLHRRFATGTYMVWYPIVDGTREAQMARAWRESGLRRIHLYQLSQRSDRAAKGMSAAVVAVVNPPWILQQSMETALRCITPLLNQDGTASFNIEELVGE